jgi:hypothetical protein
MLVGVRGAPAHSLLSHVAPGATHVPQLALQQTIPVLHVLGPHMVTVVWPIQSSALCTTLSQNVGVAPPEPPEPPMPAAASPPPVPLAPPTGAASTAADSPPFDSGFGGGVGAAVGGAAGASDRAAAVAVAGAAGVVGAAPTRVVRVRGGVTEVPLSDGRSGAIGSTSPRLSTACSTNPVVRAKRTAAAASSTTPITKPDTISIWLRLDQRRPSGDVSAGSTWGRVCTSRSNGDATANIPLFARSPSCRRTSPASRSLRAS